MQEVSSNSGAAVGIGAAGVAAAGVAAVAVKSYPYGDEEGSDDESVDLSEEKNPSSEDVFDKAEEGIEWTEEGVWSPYDGYTKREAQAVEKSQKSISSLSESRMTDSRSDKQKERPGWMKSWSSIDSFREKRKPPKNPNAYMSSIDSTRDTQSRSTLLGSLAEDEEVEEEELFVQAAARAVEAETLESGAALESAPMSPPTVSSAGTSNAVRMSPTASAATEVVVSEKAVVEENDDDADSVLTEDIVKEVSRLARFVKRYDKKRERKLLKDRERNEKAALAKDSQSYPSTSIGYDAMSDSISALRKGPVEVSPRRERAALANAVEETDESDESERSWSTTSNANRAFDDDDDDDEDSLVDESEIDVSDESDDDMSEAPSDLSRLGITPFSIQKVVGVPTTANPAKRLMRADASAPETSRPPVTGKERDSKGLPPISYTPGSPDEDSPEKTTPVKSIKNAMMRVSSARQQKFAQMNTHEEEPRSKQSRDVGLTEDALHELADGNGQAGVSSPYRQQQKGALAVLRKNEAILDSASSHVTDGVTSSQYEQAFKVGTVTQQQQRKVYLERNSFKQMQQRIPRDPPAKISGSASLQETDEKRSPPGWEAKDPSMEMRVPPAQSSPQLQTRKQPAPRESVPEERPPWSKSAAPQAAPETQPSQSQSTQKWRAPSSTGNQSSATSAQAATETRTAQSQPTQKWRAPSKPTNQPSSAAAPRNTLANPSASFGAQSGTKRAAPEAPPMTPGGTQETAPAQISPALRSPPRRKNKTGSAFNNVISMFEQRPKNPIYPATDGWQYNGASR